MSRGPTPEMQRQATSESVIGRVVGGWLIMCNATLAGQEGAQPVVLALLPPPQGEELKAAGLPVGGSLTPAAAGGKLLVERLKDEGIKFEVKEEDAVAGLP